MKLIWVLLVITWGQSVTWSDMPGKAACEEARSLVLYNQTVDEHNAELAAQAAKAKADRDAYEAAHPAECARDKLCYLNSALAESYTFVGAGGVTRDENGNISSISLVPQKIARCVMVPLESSAAARRASPK